jgi:hypothetical protein
MKGIRTWSVLDGIQNRKQKIKTAYSFPVGLMRKYFQFHTTLQIYGALLESRTLIAYATCDIFIHGNKSHNFNRKFAIRDLFLAEFLRTSVCRTLFGTHHFKAISHGLFSYIVSTTVVL